MAKKHGVSKEVDLMQDKIALQMVAEAERLAAELIANEPDEAKKQVYRDRVQSYREYYGDRLNPNDDVPCEKPLPASHVDSE